MHHRHRIQTLDLASVESFWLRGRLDSSEPPAPPDPPLRDVAAPVHQSGVLGLARWL